MSAQAQICLYGTPASGFAYLTMREGLAHAIESKGGWNGAESAPSGALRSISQTIELAKASLRDRGVGRGDAIVFFPGGEHCARTRLEEYQPVATMQLEAAPPVVITPKTIERAARAIANGKRDPSRQEWHEGYVEWQRPIGEGEHRPVAIFRGNLVWVSPGEGSEGGWGIVQAFSKPLREIQVGRRWFPLARVLSRQEAIAQSVPPPAHTSAIEHAPFVLVLDALRARRVSIGKTLELVTAHGVTLHLPVLHVSDDRGAGPITSMITVGSTLEGARVELVIPTDVDHTGAPLHRAELRWNARERVDVLPTSIRFVSEAAAPAPAARSRAARSKGTRSKHARSKDVRLKDATKREATTKEAPEHEEPAHSRKPDEWERHRVRWYRSVTAADGDVGHVLVELRKGDLVWASFGYGSKDFRTKGTWGRIEGFSRARGMIRVGRLWHKLPLVYTREEAIARGVEPPAEPASPKIGKLDTPFSELIYQLRTRGRGRALEIVSTDHTPHTMQVSRVETDATKILVDGTIKQSESRLAIHTETDAQGFPRYLADLRKGSRSYRVDPRRVHLAREPKPADAGGAP
jgi:hypothetical protein